MKLEIQMENGWKSPRNLALVRQNAELKRTSEVSWFDETDF